MNIRITFKTPDVLDILDNYVVKHCGDHDDYQQYCADCFNYKREANNKIKDFKNKLRKFILYDEYVSIDFDVETGTATVVPNLTR